MNVLLLCSFVYLLTVNSGLSRLLSSYISSERRSSPSRGEENDFTSSVTVVTEKTQYHGSLLNVLNKSVSVFLGIAYAVAPIGRLRFRAPQPLVRLPRHVNASEYAPKCPQIAKKVPIFTDLTKTQSEDCLYLNIWTPFAPDSRGHIKVKREERKSVMIWFHGGGFFKGTSSMDQTDGGILSSLGDVIIVTFQYRLGPFGFLTLNSHLESGNQGLYDQLAVMQFVKSNIHHWGGDSNSITLFGESSGAIAISLHMISPLSSKLFTRAILQSGSAFMTDQFYQRSTDSTPELVKLLKCLRESNETSSPSDSENDEDSDIEDGQFNSQDDEAAEYDVECLKSKSVGEILDASSILHEKYFFSFHPTPGDQMMPLLPTEFARKSTQERNETLKNIKQVLLGSNLNAFSYMLYLANNETFSQLGVTRRFDSLQSLVDLMNGPLNHLLQMTPFQVKFVAEKLLKSVRNESNSEVLVEKLIEVLGDLSFICPLNQVARELSSLAKDVYFYLYTHVSRSTTPWSPWFGSTLHDEVAFIFGHPLRFPHKYSGVDIDLSKRLISVWTEFAKTGVIKAQDKVEWLKYTPKQPFYMQINSKSVQLKSNLSRENCESFQLAFDLLS